VPYLLVALDTSTQIHRVELRNPFRVGRHPENDLSLSDVRISRHHIRFEKTERGWEVFDDGSTSGFYVNDSRGGDSHLLVDGDVICIGGTLLTFRMD